MIGAVTLRILVVIALRFYAIYFLVVLVGALPTFISFAGVAPELRGGEYVGLGAYLILALGLWFAANRLAGGIVREFDSSVQLHLTLEDAYAFAFVFLGLYFFLSSVASAVVQFVHLLSIAGQSPDGTHDASEARAITELYRPGITFIVGLASLLGSRAWSRKLATRSSKSVG
jgi:hypothetical protein